MIKLKKVHEVPYFGWNLHKLNHFSAKVVIINGFVILKIFDKFDHFSIEHLTLIHSWQIKRTRLFFRNFMLSFTQYRTEISIIYIPRPPQIDAILKTLLSLKYCNSKLLSQSIPADCQFKILDQVCWQKVVVRNKNTNSQIYRLTKFTMWWFSMKNCRNEYKTFDDNQIKMLNKAKPNDVLRTSETKFKSKMAEILGPQNLILFQLSTTVRSQTVSHKPFASTVRSSH